MSWIQSNNLWICSPTFSLSAMSVMKYRSSILISLKLLITSVIYIKMEFLYFMTNIALRLNERLQIQTLLECIQLLLLTF